MIIRNLASNQKFFAHPVRRPKTGDRSGLKSRVELILYCFNLLTGRIADIHIS